jgi:hypothetical protein
MDGFGLVDRALYCGDVMLGEVPDQFAGCAGSGSR